MNEGKKNRGRGKLEGINIGLEGETGTIRDKGRENGWDKEKEGDKTEILTGVRQGKKRTTKDKRREGKSGEARKQRRKSKGREGESWRASGRY